MQRCRSWWGIVCIPNKGKYYGLVLNVTILRRSKDKRPYLGHLPIRTSDIIVTARLATHGLLNVSCMQPFRQNQGWLGGNF